MNTIELGNAMYHGKKSSEYLRNTTLPENKNNQVADTIDDLLRFLNRSQELLELGRVERQGIYALANKYEKEIKELRENFSIDKEIE